MSQVTIGNGVTSSKADLSPGYQSFLKIGSSVLGGQGDLVIDIPAYGSDSTWLLQDVIKGEFGTC